MVEALGHKLATHHPVIEPVSENRVRNGIFRCRDRRSNPPFCLAETGGRTRKSPLFAGRMHGCPRSSIPEDCVVEVVGHKLKTPPVIEPVSDSESGTEFFDAETGLASRRAGADAARA